MTTPEALRAAPRTRVLPASIVASVPASSRDLDAAPFDASALALWDDGLRRLGVRP